MKQIIKKMLFKACQLNFTLIEKVLGVTQLHRLLGDSTVIDILRRKAGSQLTPFYSVKVFYDFAQLAKNNNIQPRRVLEIGTGCSLSTLACFLASGAEYAAGIDIQPMDKKEEKSYRDTARYLAVASGFGWWRHMVDLNCPPYIKFHDWNEKTFLDYVNQVDYQAPVQADKMPFPDDSFDYIYSNAVLEHIQNAEGAIAEIARVLEHGGLTAHEIDLRDHNSIFPLEFLTFSKDEWEKISGKYGGGKGIERLLDSSWDGRVYCNRLLVSDWVRIFEQSGFEVVTIEPIMSVDKSAINKEKFSEPFRAKTTDDLAIVVVRIVAKFPSDPKES